MAEDRQARRDIGALIVAARYRAGLKQGQLATKLGISEDHLGRIERGVQSVDATRLRKIAEVTEVRPDWFTQTFDEPAEDLSVLEERIRELEDWRAEEEHRRDEEEAS
jgi:transcriptional regulator with XRE-family HTH domain